MVEAARSAKELEKPKALLIEDEPIALKVHKTYLEKIGFEVEVATEGHEALEKYKQKNLLYKLALLDARLPSIDGFDIANYIREYELKNNIARMPIIIVSAEPYRTLEQKCISSGVDNFIQKPIRYEQLKSVVLKIINKNCICEI